MDEKEETQTEGNQQEETSQSTDVGNAPQEEISPLDEAKQVLLETKKHLIAITAERQKIEKAAADLLVNGRSFAGQRPKEKTEDEKWAESAKERYAGTGMDPTL